MEAAPQVTRTKVGDLSIEQTGFNPNKHFYLPIPQTALDAYPGMKQNPGY